MFRTIRERRRLRKLSARAADRQLSPAERGELRVLQAEHADSSLAHGADAWAGYVPPQDDGKRPY